MHLLQPTDLDYKTLSKDYKKRFKKPQIGLQHPQIIVYRHENTHGLVDQKDFRPTRIYYKPTDLDHKTLSKDYKKRQKTTDWLAATLNKLYIDMETLRMV